MSKTDVRNKTGEYLNNSQGLNSFRLDSRNNLYTGATITGNKKSLTGALEPILPIKVVSIGKANKGTIDFTFLMNPESWNHAKTNSYQSVYTRSGWSVQLWGPNQDTISSNGKTAAMMNPGVGLDSFVRETTFSYLNLLALISAYKTNGYEFYDELSPNLTTRVISRIRGVHLMYDGQDFMGHFSNFTVDEDDEHPYLFNYNFKFIISSLRGDETEISGHYKRLEMPQKEKTSVAKVTKPKLEVISDVYTKEPDGKIELPKPMDDRITQRLWEIKTGLPWSDAIKYGLTDGSVQGNLVLRNLLYSKKWDPQSQTFV
jgi:hypothetical protein